MSSVASSELISTVQRWMYKCETYHQSCVPSLVPMRPQHEVPTWIIDLQRSCIVPGTSADRYFTLSYTWPRNESASGATCGPLLLDENNINEFQNPGFFASNQALQGLPAVIKFAMKFTLRMGERYLWVDRLCIVQDEASTQHEVMRMDKIYAGSHLNIIAAAPGHIFTEYLDAGWPYAVPEGANPNVSEHYSLREEFWLTVATSYNKLDQTTWASRGWTYQEQILCARAVMFLPDRFFWDCHSATWHGNPCPWEDFIIPGSKSLSAGSHWWPNFNDYIIFVSFFNGRQFSYPQDALSGFTGILNHLAPFFPGGFLSGLPRLSFDHALLWQPFGKASRRSDRAKYTNSHSFTTSSLPSWAWCGWQCFVDPLSLRSGEVHIRTEKGRLQGISWRTRTIVNWRYSDTNLKAQNGKLNQPDQNLTENLNHIWNTGNFTGWRCNSSENEAVYFTHIRDEGVRFNFPFPLASSTSGINPVKTLSYISCSTTSAWLLPAAVFMAHGGQIFEATRQEYAMGYRAYRVFSESLEDESHCSVLALQQVDGTFAGLIRLMDDADFSTNAALELYAISAGSASVEDMQESFEWTVFNTGEMKYQSGFRVVYYKPEIKSPRGDMALKCDISVAFNINRETTTNADLEIGIFTDKNNKKCDCVKRWKCAVSDPETGEDKKYKIWRATCSPSSRYEASREHRAAASTSHGTQTCEFYNVLWVERKDGIAYRRACGWVPKHIWEANAHGPVELTLG